MDSWIQEHKIFLVCNSMQGSRVLVHGEGFAVICVSSMVCFLLISLRFLLFSLIYGRKGLSSCFDFLDSESLYFSEISVLQKALGPFFTQRWSTLAPSLLLINDGGVIREIVVNTNTQNLASNGFMFTKQKQEAKSLMQFMGGGKQLGRSFDTCSILNSCQKSESVMHPSTALFLIRQRCKKKSVLSKCGLTTMLRVCYSSKTIIR